MNKQDALLTIRRAAVADRVHITFHASIRMEQRNIARSMLFDALKHGRINRQPEPNIAKGALECRIDHYNAGLNFAVIVAIPDCNPNIVIVTVLD